MTWLFLYKAIWGGVTALGFAALFNAPARSFFHIFLLGAVGVFLKIVLRTVFMSMLYLHPYQVQWLLIF